MVIRVAKVGLTLHGQLPARLTSEQAAWVLNCQPHDVPVLVAERLLKPLGNPPPNCVKYFASLEIQELVKDRAWLSKVTNTLNLHWQRKNSRKQGTAEDGQAQLTGLPVSMSGKFLAG